MLTTYLKYCFILISSLHCFKGLLNLNFTFKNQLINFISPLLWAIVICITRSKISYITELFLVIIISCHSLLQFGLTIKITTITALIAVTLSHLLLVLSTITALPVLLLITSTVSNSYIETLLCITCAGILQCLLSIGLFRIKRFRRGMPFLLNKIPLSIVITICIIVMAFFVFAALPNTSYTHAALIFLLCIPFGFLLITWWRKQLNISYLNKAHQNEIKRLDAEIAQLKQDNEHMAYLIHKDNKLLPAMEHAVHTLLSNCGTMSSEEVQQQATSLLSDLNALINERKGMLDSQLKQHQTLPSTNLIRLDSILRYMCEKAESSGISFELHLDADIQPLIDSTIRLDALVTLIADLAENAIIATKDAKIKNIKIAFTIRNGVYCIDIYDSGIPFTPYTIANAGLKKASTHLDSGGSGIGLMTTFRLLIHSLSSFVIDELVEDERFTKMVSVQFDSLNQFRIYTKRTEILELERSNPRLIINS